MKALKNALGRRFDFKGVLYVLYAEVARNLC